MYVRSQRISVGSLGDYLFIPVLLNFGIQQWELNVVAALPVSLSMQHLTLLLASSMYTKAVTSQKHSDSALWSNNKNPFTWPTKNFWAQGVPSTFTLMSVLIKTDTFDWWDVAYGVPKIFFVDVFRRKFKSTSEVYPPLWDARRILMAQVSSLSLHPK